MKYVARYVSPRRIISKHEATDVACGVSVAEFCEWQESDKPRPISWKLQKRASMRCSVSRILDCIGRGKESQSLSEKGRSDSESGAL
jgi:hypothetical protein